MAGACVCEKFPLNKGGSAKGAGVVWQSRKAKGRGHPLRYDALKSNFPIRTTTPRRLRDHCRYAAAPFVEGGILSQRQAGEGNRCRV